MSQTLEKFGKYNLLEKIQTGGMAEIYLARKPGASGVSKFVAIKRILPQFSEQADFIDMFKDEAKIAVNLAHANIVSIHEFGMEKNQFFIAMDFVEGRNLRQIINKMKKSGVSFSTEQCLFIIKEVAAGLDHAHRCIDANTGKPLNIIHRDMSPQNVMVNFEGEVKIVDFGIAKAETQLETTRAGTLKGKFSYMSPEQAEGQGVDLRTDIFALGIVLWELLANDRLFVSNNEANTLRKVRDCQIPSLRKINPSIPPELERIVSKALAKDRNLRYQTAAALHRELSRFLNRQYPDFSQHDFSVFIKTLFAVEILENRKKMIEYAKIEASSVPEDLAASPPESYGREPSPSGAKAQAPVAIDTTHTENTEPPTDKEWSEATPAQRPVNDAVPPTPLASARSTATRNPQPPPQSKVGKIDLNAQGPEGSNANLRIERGANPANRDGTQSYGGKSKFSTTSSQTGYRLEPKESSSFLSALMIGIGLAAGVAAIFPQEAMQFVNTNLARITGRSAKPVQSMEVTDLGSTAPRVYKIRVESNPSGAEVILDGTPTGDVTPTTVEVERNKEVTITVRKAGYSSFEQRETIDSNKMLSIPLQREALGRLDINVVGAGRIFVDGKLIADGSPAQNVVVSANRELLVRAEDPVTKASDEMRVMVAENASKKITLIPRLKAVGPDEKPRAQAPGNSTSSQKR